MLKKISDRKGQLTWFVVVSFIILIVILLVFFFTSYTWTNPLKQKTSQEVELSEAVESIRSYTQSCITSLAEEGLILLGNQGGLITLEDYIQTDYANISSYLPAEAIINKELSDYISQNLQKSCIFENNTSYEVESSSKITTEISFKEDKVIVEATFPITIRSANDTKLLKDFKTMLPVRMSKIYETAKSITESNEVISYAESLEDMKLSIYKEEDTKVFVLTDKKSKIRGKTYKFLFTDKKV